MKFIIQKKQFILGFLSLLIFAGCQRDDICPETVDTTPMLVINFYANNAQNEPRTSVNLTVREVGRDTLDMLLYRVNSQSIRIPLKTGQNSTKYEFIYNGPAYNENGEIIENQDNNLETNTDIIEFTYDPEEEYINRACSFKVNYLNIDYPVGYGASESKIEQDYSVVGLPSTFLIDTEGNVRYKWLGAWEKDTVYNAVIDVLED